MYIVFGGVRCNAMAYFTDYSIVQGTQEGVWLSRVPTASVVCSRSHLIPVLCLPWEATRLTVVNEVSQNSTSHKKLEFFNLYCIFPLPLSPLIPPCPQQSPHCCPCPWAKILNFIISNKYRQFILKWQTYFIRFWETICQILTLYNHNLSVNISLK